MDSKGKPNRLAKEQSPYLLQHARNPVDWFPWGPEAFEKARREDKPVFLSIGYSTCHWCHVMEKESFEDPEVAKAMNDAFVSIKVDREERPDIDALYMSVCQMATGSGGWPLTIVMAPDGRPFFAATYIPKSARFGRMGMLELVPRIREMWRKQRPQLLESAEQIAQALRDSSKAPPGADLGPDVLDAACEQLARRFDEVNGGFGTAPKFPSPHNLLFLLRHWKRTGNPGALDMVERTLRAMRMGGVYDHVGFGFHRYSTDAEWLVPHFEKMLYDQALLAMACTEAFQATRKEEFRRVAEEIFEYVLRDMTSPEGGFYSAEDADSEGEEGKFYLWTVAEMREVLGASDAEFAAKAWNAESGGNFIEEATGNRSGGNILFLAKPPEELAPALGLPASALRERLESVRKRLFAARSRRVRPLRDDKVLADWNGLMIAAFARAAQAHGNSGSAHVGTATRAAEFVLSKMRDSRGRLLHRYRSGEAAIPGTAEDYAFLVWGLIELYEATFEARWLEEALRLNRDFIERFWDPADGGFFLAASDAEPLIARTKEIHDGAIPSANSVAMLNLLRLARLTGDAALEGRAAAIGRAFSATVRPTPAAHAMLMCAVDFATGPVREVVIVGKPGAPDTRAMVEALRKEFAPRMVALFRPSDESDPAIARLAPYTRDLKAVGGKATACVCADFACEMPVTDPEKMVELLRK
ncbi:MAG: thioredoxin domain-containing protein [Halobacteria archaeon]